VGEFLRAGVVVQEGRIAAVGGEPPADAERVDCTRFAVVPGMVNAHCHSNENWFRGLWDNLPLEPWMLFSYPVLAAPPQSPDEIYVRTLLGGIEMIRSGATCVVDFLYELQGFTDDSLAETRMQALSGRRMYGRTLVEHLDRIGFLGPRICFEHGIWLTPHDVELVRDRGVTVVHNPVSNMKLGSGICPVPTLLAEGVNVALGTDGMSSNDGNDMFATLKAAALLHKLWEIDYERWLGAEEAWRMATAAGARAAGDADGLGTIEAGRRADPRAARPREHGLHAAERPAQAAGARLDHARRRLDARRRPLGAPRRTGHGRRRGRDPRAGPGARTRARRPARRGLPRRAAAARVGAGRLARGPRRGRGSQALAAALE